MTEHSHWNTFDRSQKIYIWLAAVFLTCLLIANLIGNLLFSVSIPGIPDPVLFSAGIIPFPVTFILTDLLNEFYGKQGARFVTYIGFAMSILVFVFLRIGETLPVDRISDFTHEQYVHFSGMYTRMFLASLTAYLVGQLLDIQVFHLFRSVTKHRFIWLRATGSTVVSQIFDSLIITFIAFWGTHPASDLLRIAMGNYSWKFVIAVGITPLLYLGHVALKKLMPLQEARLERAEPEYR